MKVIFFVGLPASGKSTFWGQQYAADNQFTNVESDKIRHILMPNFSWENWGKVWKEKEPEVRKLWKKEVIKGIMEGKNVVVSDTNLSVAVVKKNVEFLRYAFPNVEIEFKFFPKLPIKILKTRNLSRQYPIDGQVLTNMWRNYKPSLLKKEYKNLGKIV